MKNPLNLRTMYLKDDYVGQVINEIPTFKTNILIDDVSQIVYKRFLDNGEPVIAIFPYECAVYFEIKKGDQND